MNNLDKIIEKTGFDAVTFSKEYTSYLITLLQSLDHQSIAGCIEQMEIARQNGNTIFIIGNGGSASTASHIATDFGTAVLKKSGKEDYLPYRALALTDNVSIISATANDSAYTNIFLTS